MTRHVVAVALVVVGGAALSVLTPEAEAPRVVVAMAYGGCFGCPPGGTTWTIVLDDGRVIRYVNPSWEADFDDAGRLQVSYRSLVRQDGAEQGTLSSPARARLSDAVADVDGLQPPAARDMSDFIDVGHGFLLVKKGPALVQVPYHWEDAAPGWTELRAAFGVGIREALP